MRPGGIVRTAVLGAVLVISVVGSSGAREARCTKDSKDCAASMREMFQTRGWSGIEEESHNDDWTRTIRSIIPGSPADRVGLKAGDVIVSVNGMTLSEVNEPRVRTLYAKGFKIGERLSIGIMRGDEISTIKVPLERIPDAVLTARIERHGKEQHRMARK